MYYLLWCFFISDLIFDILDYLNCVVSSLTVSRNQSCHRFLPREAKDLHPTCVKCCGLKYNVITLKMCALSGMMVSGLYLQVADRISFEMPQEKEEKVS